MRDFVFILVLAVSLQTSGLCAEPARAGELDLRPRPQIVNREETGLAVTSETRIVLPEGWPAYVTVAAEELARALKASGGVEPAVVHQARMEPKRGDIVVGPYWTVRPPWVEPLPQGLVRPAPAEGHNIRIDEKHCAVLGNSPRACFLGLQTLIQIARQTGKSPDGTLTLPGIVISDWPAHDWRTLQLHLSHPGSPYDRGQHVYTVVTTARIMERSVRLAAYSKMTGLVVDVESGMKYDRHPENFTTGITRNEKADVRAAVDLAKSLGLRLVPKSNSSSGHDGWVIPYAFAIPNTDIYIEEMHDLYDEIIETFRPSHFHVGLDEDVFHDMDGLPLRDTATHKKVLLADYEFLLRRGITMLMWNDGITQLGRDIADVPRDIVVHPWMYGGWDFTGAKRHIDQGFRILCSPWSCWHVENDQFFSIYGLSLRSEKMLGMAGTFWYSLGADDTDYRRCLVKAADAFWNPLQAGDYPNYTEYYSPEYAGLPGETLSHVQPMAIPNAELPDLVALVTGLADDHFACETARERLVAAGTTVIAPLVEAMAENAEDVSPWAEGTVRRIVREPFGDTAPMVKALEAAAVTTGPLRALALEMLAASGDVAFLEQQDASDPAVSFAMGVSGDKGFLPVLLKAGSAKGPAQVNALMALGRLKGTDELLSLKRAWKGFNDSAREAYARALAMQASEAAIPVLGELAGDANWRVRFRAAVGLGATQSVQAGSHILTLLTDENPAVFKVALYWCTDTLILKPEEYFPALIARLNLDEEKAIVRPILHSLLQMWDPGRGQWLSRNEDPSKRVNYPKLSVWKDKALIKALNTMIGYKSARHASYSMLLLMKMGAELETDTIVSAVKQFALEEQRWFCERMRNERRADMAPVFEQLWEIEDNLVRNFILQYCGMLIIPETFEIAYRAQSDIPEKNERLRSLSVYSMAAHVKKLDETARRAIPFILDLYEKTAWSGGRQTLDSALCRAAGRTPPKLLDDDPEEIAKRVAEWRKWWQEVNSGEKTPGD